MPRVDTTALQHLVSLKVGDTVECKGPIPKLDYKVCSMLLVQDEASSTLHAG